MNKHRHLWSGVAVLAIAGCILGLAANALRPSGALPWTTYWPKDLESRAAGLGIGLVELDELRASVRDGSWILVDARPQEEYDAGHLPGALPLPASQVDSGLGDLRLFLIPDQRAAVYCSGAAFEDSLIVAKAIFDAGHTNVSVFAGGFEAWRKAGLPVEGGGR